jgi:hypothetical protein
MSSHLKFSTPLVVGEEERRKIYICELLTYSISLSLHCGALKKPLHTVVVVVVISCAHIIYAKFALIKSS